LVTAAHVAKELTGTAMVTMSTTDSHPILIQLVDLIGTDPVFWKVNENADVAVHRLMPTPTLGPVLAGRFLPSELLVGKLSVPSRETPLLVMGFPLGLESSTYFSPWSRQTHAASGLLEEPGKNCVFFVLEDPSVGGYSGAPCFNTGIIKFGTATITS